ncbi:GTPase domain-containing protein [Promethearchaeum syntrophicum]|uniref:GTPase domain-containing protein n=1 Tax=Promethearchaeum syntrophicum TaxID=2594042 RepID=A0A5B9DBJ0_9ARCH|nr:GTPase domain-containing protein [Candidatus Prometheoarchaeum syntrophicum]QEE16619.1 ADP-ribosylation factor family protein [Candidatus Prometheoarchaeum syntrophicum]
MPKGIVLVGWDNKMGSTIEVKFPKDYQIQNKKITQYLVTLQTFGRSSNIQIRDNEDIILIFGYPVREGPANYDFIIVILDSLEESEIPKIQSKLNLEGGNILKTPKPKRSKLFLDFAGNFIKQEQKKIVFMGYPNSGKTTTKLFFFEKIQSEKLLETTFTPTKGIETDRYSLIDSNIALFDTSGQEIERWFNIDETPLIGSDLTIFFITAMDWKRNPEKVKNDLNRLIQLSEKLDESDHDLVLFCHKFDEITENIEEFKISLIDFTQTLDISVFFTSIKDTGNFDIYIGYQLMLRKFSPLFAFINNSLNPLMSRYQQSGNLLFILDSDFTLITDFTHSIEDFDVANIQQFKSTTIKMMKIINLDDNKSSDFITFTYESSAKIVVCLRISKFNPDFSYVIMQADSYQLVDEIYKEYNKMKENFTWVEHNN